MAFAMTVTIMRREGIKKFKNKWSFSTIECSVSKDPGKIYLATLIFCFPPEVVGLDEEGQKIAKS